MSLKKIGFFVGLIVAVITINNLVQSIYTMNQKKLLVEQTKQELEKEKKINQQLKKDLAAIKKPQYIEEEARNNLFLTKPGEDVVILPSDYLKTSPPPKPKKQDTRPNWQKWWELFF